MAQSYESDGTPAGRNYILYAYCLMSNHIHLLIREREDTIGMAIKRIASSYSHVKNMKRIETDATVSAFHGPTIILQTIYMNMVGQWFESVLEQELLDIEKQSKEPQKEIEVDGKKLKIRNNGERVTNDGIEAGDIYEGGMINPSYSKLTRKMVDYDYVKTVLEDCRLYSDSKLEYLRT